MKKEYLLLSLSILLFLSVLALIVSLLLTWRRRFYNVSTHHKLPFRYEVIAVFLSPLIWLWCLPDKLKERRISRTTVRGVFERYTVNMSDPNAFCKYTREEQGVAMTKLVEFFKGHPGLFKGLPGGVRDIYGYPKYCCICLNVTPLQVNRYYIPWERLEVFKYEIDRYYRDTHQ